MLSPALRARMRQTVTLSTMASMDAYGTASYGTAKTYRCRVENAQKYIKGPDGREVLSNATVYVANTSTGGYPPRTLAPTGKIVLPDGSSPGILAVDENPDSTGGRHHTVIYCG